MFNVFLFIIILVIIIVRVVGCHYDCHVKFLTTYIIIVWDAWDVWDILDLIPKTTVPINITYLT